jgi:uncharacterized protein YegL
MCSGFDEFMNGQRAVEGEATVTLARFDDKYELIYDMVPIDDVKALELVPRGMTALLDGMGKTINSVKEQIIKIDENDRPARCIFIVITDGAENSSQEFSKESVFELIENLKKDEEVNYEFVFLGANQDAIQSGAEYGFGRATSMSYAANKTGTDKMYESLSKSVACFRSAPSQMATMNFSEEDRENSMGVNPDTSDKQN